MPTPRPADLGLRREIARPLVRSILAHARASYGFPDRSPERVVRQLWPHDKEALRIVTRAPTAQANLATPGWSPELGQNVVSDLMVALGPASAGSQILRRSNVLSLDRFASITVPGLVASATNASFIAEGMAIPIRQLDTSKTIKLSPKKFACGFVLSRELVESSNAENLIRMVLVNSVGLSLDSVLFSNAAGTAASPPGLLFNVPPLPAAAGGGQGAFVDDIGALAGSVATVGALDICFVASPAEAVKILLWAGPRFQFAVYASSALTKTVIAVAPIAICAVADPTPEIQEGREALLHMDTAPSDPIMAGQPVKSMWQLDSSGFRLVFDCDWGLLNAAGVAWITNVTW
jgi:hypothetical protein